MPPDNQQIKKPDNNTNQTRPGELSKTTFACMFVTALFFDAVQALVNLIPIAGQVISSLVAFFAWLTFFVWMKMHGINFNSARRVASMFGGFIIELIPILNILPAWSLAITLIYMDCKAKKVLSVVPGGGVIVSSINATKGNIGTVAKV